MSDYIRKSETIKELRNYAEQKHYGGEVELANGILKAVCFIEKEDNIPTISETEIIRKAFERVLEKMESELKWTRAEQSIECTRHNGYGSPLQSKNSGKIEALKKTIKIIKEECDISE